MITDFLKLIRFKNLLMVAALQYLLLYCLIIPYLKYHYSLILGIYMTPQLSNLDFFFLVMATVLITAAGYVINDYFDLSIDMINHPQNVILGKKISLRTGLVMHWIFNIIGVALGFYISWRIDITNLGFIFLFTAGLLWYYSTIFKRELFIGNLIVALLTALIPLLVIVFEIIPLNLVFRSQLQYYYLNFNDIVFWIFGFAFFAFITTLVREIIKDIEDFEGDNAYGRKSIPIVLGIKNAKIIVVSMLLLFATAVSLALFIYVENQFSKWYINILVIVPTLFLIFKIIFAETEKDYTLASKILKLIMVTGISYLFVLYFIIKGSL
jgi:4-hydroxybenzoate polyprenyltransferase